MPPLIFTPTLTLVRQETVSDGSEGKGGRFRGVVVLRHDVVVAIRQDGSDCWLHAFRYSQPLKRSSSHYYEMSAIAICSNEQEEGLGHFILVQDKPDLHIKGYIDENLQLNLFLERSGQVPAKDRMWRSLMAPHPRCFIPKKEHMIIADSSTQQIKRVKKNKLVKWEWPRVPSQSRQFECLCICTDTRSYTRIKTKRKRVVAVSDWARRELVVLSLGEGRFLCSLNMSRFPRPEAMFFHDHHLCCLNADLGMLHVLSLDTFHSQKDPVLSSALHRKPQQGLSITEIPGSSMSNWTIVEPEPEFLGFSQRKIQYKVEPHIYVNVQPRIEEKELPQGVTIQYNVEPKIHLNIQHQSEDKELPQFQTMQYHETEPQLDVNTQHRSEELSQCRMIQYHEAPPPDVNVQHRSEEEPSSKQSSQREEDSPSSSVVPLQSNSLEDIETSKCHKDDVHESVSEQLDGLQDRPSPPKEEESAVDSQVSTETGRWTPFPLTILQSTGQFLRTCSKRLCSEGSPKVPDSNQELASPMKDVVPSRGFTWNDVHVEHCKLLLSALQHLFMRVKRMIHDKVQGVTDVDKAYVHQKISTAFDQVLWVLTKIIKPCMEYLCQLLWKVLLALLRCLSHVIQVIWEEILSTTNETPPRGGSLQYPPTPLAYDTCWGDQRPPEVNARAQMENLLTRIAPSPWPPVNQAPHIPQTSPPALKHSDTLKEERKVQGHHLGSSRQILIAKRHCRARAKIKRSSSSSPPKTQTPLAHDEACRGEQMPQELNPRTQMKTLGVTFTPRPWSTVNDSPPAREHSKTCKDEPKVPSHYVGSPMQEVLREAERDRRARRAMTERSSQLQPAPGPSCDKSASSTERVPDHYADIRNELRHAEYARRERRGWNSP